MRWHSLLTITGILAYIAETDVLPLMEVQQDQLIYQSVSSTLSTTETVGLLRPSGESVKSTYLAGCEYVTQIVCYYRRWRKIGLIQ